MKYSLRSLMIVVTLICVCLPIWLNHRRYCLDRAHSHDLESLATLSGTLTMMTADNRGEWHDSMANDYRRAVWMPWLRLGIKDDGTL
jgi:hypothetical protein